MKEKGKFIRVKCPNSECNNEQIIFGKATQIVKCNKCQAILAEPAGGKAKIRAKVLEVL